MIKTTLNWTVKQLKNMYDNKQTLSFNHPIQRQSSQWDNTQQSLLIHSLLASFPVPSIYLEKREVIDANDVEKRIYSYSVLDGKQRMTTIFSYINGEYSLSEDIPPVVIEDATYELANKFYDELDEDVKQEILRFRFNIVAFENVSDEEIEEIFFRLNNSTPLSKAQKSKPLMGVSNSVFINELISSRFFREKCSFSKMQLKKEDDMCTLLQAMMLLDVKHRDYGYKDISADNVMEYSRFINGNYPDEEKERVKKIVGFLDNCFYMKERNLKKINIPILFLMADEALERGIINSKFRTFVYDFFTFHKEEYNQYCSSGSVKKEKTEGRIRIMSEAFSKFFEEKPVEEETVSNDADENEIILADNDNLERSLSNSNEIETSSETCFETSLEENETVTDEPVELSTDESSLENTEESFYTVEIEELEESKDDSNSEVLETQTDAEFANESTEIEISTDSLQPIDSDTEIESTNETIEVSESHKEKQITTLGDLFDFRKLQTALA